MDSLKERGSAFYDFRMVCAAPDGIPSPSPNEISDALKRLHSAYQLDGKELQLIAYMAVNYPKILPFNNIGAILNEDTETVYAMVDVLQSRKFILHSFNEYALTSYITLTTDVVNSFREYKPFGKQPEYDFVEELGKADLSPIKHQSWLHRFKYELKKKPDAEFAKRWTELGVDKLPDNEAEALCAALKQFVNHFIEPLADRDNGFIDVADTSEFGKRQEGPQKYLDILVQKGLVISADEGHVIAPKVAKTLLHGHDEIVSYNAISKYVTVVKSCEIAKKELSFSDESREEIENLRYMLSMEGFNQACSLLMKKKRNPAIQSLLWGGPGTGKTETVKQIALETGRDIFLFDVAKVTASDWGATENLYRNLFMAYRYVVAVKSVTPILLINEADHVLSKRLPDVTRSIDKSENTISNILLQEFEDMHGILLATTNNAKILDEAFDRRFLFKTELKKPDAKARKKIWMSMIPDLMDKDAEYLAVQYDMSGAEINNIATKRDLAELYYKGDRGLAFIEKLCQRELWGNVRDPKYGRIGF